MRFSSFAVTALVSTQLITQSIGFSSNHHAISRQIRNQSRLLTASIEKTVEGEIIPQEQQDSFKVGDTKGAVLTVEDVAISRGPAQILSNVNLRIENNERWGIVGPNGAGKSTLLGALMGTVRIDEGDALIGPKTRVGYLKQTAVAGSTRTVAQEAASGMQEIEDTKLAMEAAGKIVEDGDYSEDALIKLQDTTEAFESAGGYTQEQSVESVLKGLGFTSEDSDTLCSDFSGGWQMRIALAKLLLSKPSLLLLDEPSNHLDSAARSWLSEYLSTYDGSLVLVSHDLTLLQKSVNNIAEVIAGTLLTYGSCNYDKYLEQKVFRAQTAQAEYERNLAEAANLQAFVDRFGASATKAKQAQDRAKKLEKMRKEGKLTPPAAAVIDNRRKPKLNLPPPPKAIGEDLISLVDADIGHDPNGPPLLKNINLEVRRGMKLLLRGPNGAGKSTLMAALRGKLELLNGKRIENDQLRLGTFTQDLAQELDVNARAIDLVTEHARTGEHGNINVSDNDARNVMGLLGLSQDKPLRKVGDLSGGEKARVALSMFTLKASNLLMLDEPSNHLDVECIEALGDALSGWGEDDGGVVVISHDRSFCETVGFDWVGTVKDGSITLEQRGLRESDWTRYQMKANDHECNIIVEEQDTIVELTDEEKEEQAKRRKMALNAPRRIKKLESIVEACESKIAQLDDEMMNVGNDVGKLTDINTEKEKEQAKVDKAMTEWEELDCAFAEFGSEF